MSGTKICSRCNKPKDLTDFAKRSKSPDGRRPNCKSCLSGYYERNKSEFVRRSKARKTKIKNILIKAKSKPCADCHVQYDYWIMQFDHLRDKAFTLGKSAANKGISQILEEIQKCDVVCANCHADRTHKRRRRTTALSSSS
jgi:hypothetical protein